MTYVPSGAPFSERGGRLRGVIDLLAGRYPPFVFGFGVGSLLPVFHFHETTPEHLTPALQYLAENGYTTVGCDHMAALVRHGTPPPPRSVVLAFDDALASLWLVAVPLLKRFGLTAVAYVIPGRVVDAPAVRPTLDDGPVEAASADRGANAFATWPELRAMVGAGTIEVQSHTWSHAMQFCDSRPSGVVTPANAAEHFLNHPRLNTTDPPEFLPMSRIGFPLFPRRSRMSDGRRFLPNAAACARVEAFVSERGGPSFFETPDWQQALAGPLAAVTGEWETEQDQRGAIEYELAASREDLERRLGVRVRHLCLPWGVTGTITRDAIARLGFETAVANRMPGMYAVRSGDDPFFLKRLPNRYIFALPGRGRRSFLTVA
jgi:peptidoglycan/xylan/chitin deacetylase (PgdA/CDA1 family)